MYVKKIAMFVTVVVAAATIVGCSSATPDTTATPTTSPVQTPPPEPTITPSPAPTLPVDPADPTTWTIDDGGVGPVRIGGDFASTLTSLPATWTNDTQNCAWTAWWSAAAKDYGIYFVRGTESETAPIREISIYSTADSNAGSPSTGLGLGLGATKAEVLAAYPGAQEGVPQTGSGSWIKLPGDSEAQVFFEFREGEDVSWHVAVTTGAEPSSEVCG